MAEPGDILADRYRLDELIGRGGMASVFRAFDLRLERPVAIKLLRPEILADPDLALRFRREAHAASVLRHPNVVACLETGTDGDRPFLVMELVDGEDLATRVRRDAPLPEVTATRLAVDVARGLAIAHARGIVHRDVKPGNILVDSTGRARITDFGVARIAAEAESTIPGTTLGSVHYFSPEQARGLPTTATSDVYSLGLVLFELLTATKPFGGDSPAAIALARVDAPSPSPRAVVPAVSPALDAVVRRALDPDPAARYPNAGAFADALEACLPLPESAGAASADSDPGSTTTRYAAPTAARPATAPAARRPSSLAPFLGLAAAVVLAAAGFAGFMLLGPDRDPAVVAGADPTTTPGTAASAATEPSAAPSVPPSDAPVTPEPPVDPTPAEPTPAGPGELCLPDPGETCALAAGSYAPSGFEPAIAFELGEGWSTFRADGQLIVLSRDEGYLTFAREISIVFDGEESYEVRSAANALLDAFRADDAIDILDQRRTRLDGHRAIQLDLVPAGDRAPLFGAGDDVYYAETDTVTRVYVLEIRGDVLLVALEGANGADLDGFLDSATDELASLRLG